MGRENFRESFTRQVVDQPPRRAVRDLDALGMAVNSFNLRETRHQLWCKMARRAVLSEPDPIWAFEWLSSR